MSTTTPNLGLTVPAMGDQISSTIPALGTNFQTIDNQVGILSKSNTEAVNVKNYGCKCDSVTDDTANFKTAINDAKANGFKLLIPGQMLITDEITIDQAVWIEGTGEAGHNHFRPIATILFNNTAVDGSGNATKCLFRIPAPTVSYKSHFITIQNLTIQHMSSVPKNQHSIIVDNTLIAYFRLRNMKFYDSTGCSIFLKGNGTANNPQIYFSDWDGIYCSNVGGIVGQLTGTKAWIHTGTVKNVDLENLINPVSPNAVICDFSGFQNMKFESFIVEGNGATGVNSAIKVDQNTNNFKNIYFELKITIPPYAFDISASTVIENVYGMSTTFKCKISGKATVVKLRQIQGMYGNAVFEVNDGQYVINDSPLGGDYNSGNVDDNPFVDTTLAGRGKIENSSMARGVTYNQDLSIPLYQMNKGVPFASGDAVSELVTVQPSGAFPYVDSYYDSSAGRVLKITPSDSAYADFWYWQITVPTEFIGSNITIGMKVKINSSGAIKDFILPGISGSTQYAQFNGKITDTNGKKNQWVYCYASVRATATPINFRIDFTLSGYTAVTQFYVADVQVLLGNKLPTLSPKFDQNITFAKSALPTRGYFRKGDICQNTNPTPGGTVGWVCTTTGNMSNTAWAASTAYTVGQQVNTGGNVYECITAGTSGASAPTGTGTSITDGTVTWTYLNPLAVFKTYGTIAT